ncbi:telomerase Cajal body protein 1 homolog [Sabethes cyaneus]|uniref:telomerase Cajal body protein 1 homolog n=1 Tax=Sabethes cyaneus TaxID=53552 RepID=UPI00237DAED5|nr:telomerase Cajal body protein 1 homolog [Sabethes cyaneus]
MEQTEKDEPNWDEKQVESMSDNLDIQMEVTNDILPIVESSNQEDVVERQKEMAIEETLLNVADSGPNSPLAEDEEVLLEENKATVDEGTELLEHKDNLTNGTIEDANPPPPAEIMDYEIDMETKSATYEQDFFQALTACEVGRCSWDRAEKQNYVRGCLWSPDGTCVLAAVNGDGMHVLELPADMYEAQQISTERPVQLLDSAVHVRETTLVYDYKWYPGMQSSMPETSVWIASRQHEPIQMWDAYTGKLRCSYKGYNAVDEVEAALSITWSLDGGFIFGGYKKSIKMFDVKTPGREISSFPTKVTASCMTMCSPLPNLLIFGSWSRSITALATNSNQTTIPVGNNSRECSHNAGVTWLRFIPRTNLFVSGGRKDPKLLVWDIRRLDRPYHVLQRTCDTNQRVYFDSSPYGEWVVTGNTDGVVRAWNLMDVETERKTYRQYNFPLHRDCCNGVAFHPFKPIIATASGQHHFPPAEEFSEEQTLPSDAGQSNKVENSLTMWWVGAVNVSEQ